MTAVVLVLLNVFLILATSAWIGGAACLVVVSLISRTTLSASDRVALFRKVGKRWGIIGTAALVIAYVCGLILLLTAPWTALSTWLMVLGALLAATLAVGIIQARRMTRLRRTAATAGAPAPRSVLAAALRTAIVVISVAMVTLAVLRTLAG